MNNIVNLKGVVEIMQENTEVNNRQRSYDLSNRRIFIKRLNNGVYDGKIVDSYVESSKSNQIKVEIKLREYEMFETSFRVDNMLWHKPWNDFFIKNNIKNIDQMENMNIKFTIKNNVNNFGTFSDVTKIEKINKVND